MVDDGAVRQSSRQQSVLRIAKLRGRWEVPGCFATLLTLGMGCATIRRSDDQLERRVKAMTIRCTYRYARAILDKLGDRAESNAFAAERLTPETTWDTLQGTFTIHLLW